VDNCHKSVDNFLKRIKLVDNCKGDLGGLH